MDAQQEILVRQGQHTEAIGALKDDVAEIRADVKKLLAMKHRVGGWTDIGALIASALTGAVAAWFTRHLA